MRLFPVSEKRWFRVNQRRLLALANHPDRGYRRDVRARLSLPDWPIITRIAPHAIHGMLDSERERIAQFASRPAWARVIRQEWDWWTRPERERASRLWDHPDAYGRRMAADVALYYPDSGDPGVTTMDGHIACFAPVNNPYSWSTMWGKSAGTQLNTPSQTLDPIRLMMCPIGFSPLGSNMDRLCRGMCGFDLSMLPAADVTGGSLGLYVTASADTGSFAPSINIYSANPASYLTLALADFDTSHYGTSAFATAKVLASLTLNARNTWTFNSTGVAAIMAALQTSPTVPILFLSIRSHYDATNTAPAYPGGNPSCYFYAYSAEYPTDPTNTIPLLTVTYTPLADPSSPPSEINDTLHILKDSCSQSLANPTANRIRYRFAYNYATGKWDQELTLDNTTDQTALGEVIEEVIELLWVRDSATALTVAQRHLDWLDEDAWQIELEAPLPLMTDKQIGSSVEVDHHAILGGVPLAYKIINRTTDPDTMKVKIRGIRDVS